MPLSYPIRNNFTTGEVSPLIHARPETKGYQNGLKRCRDFIVLPHGGIGKRCGFHAVYDTYTADASSKVALIPFSFSQNPSQSYQLEFSHNKIRFYKVVNHSIITSSGEYEVATTYTADQVQDIRYAQSNDVLYLVHEDHPPRKLTRYGETDWRLEDMSLISDFTNPLPGKLRYRVFNWSDDIYATLPNSPTNMNIFFDVGYHDATQKVLEGNHEESPYGLAFSYLLTDYPYVPYLIGLRLGDSNISVEYYGSIYIPASAFYSFSLNNNGSADLTIDGETPFVESYLHDNPESSGSNTEFKNDNIATRFLSEGNKNITLRYLNKDYRDGLSCAIGWRREGNAAGIVYSGEHTSNITLTRKWFGNKIFEVRITIEDGGDTYKWEYRWNDDIIYKNDHQAGDYISRQEYIANGTGYSEAGTVSEDNEDSYTDWILGATDIGFGGTYGLNTGPGHLGEPNQEIYLADVVVPAGHSAGETFTFKCGYAYIPPEQFKKVREVQENLYPRTVTFHGGRLWFGGSRERPNVLWASRSNDFENFTQGSNADDALEFLIGSANIDPIYWLVSSDDLFIGTVSGEYLGFSNDDVITPDSFICKKKSHTGSAFVQPALTGTEIIFTDHSRRKLYQYSYGDVENTFVAVDLSIVYDHLTQNKIKQIVYQKAGRIVYGYSVAINTIWVVTDAGELIGITYEKQHEVVAWHKHTFGNGVVESIAVVPGEHGEELWLSIKYTHNEHKFRFIGYLDHNYDNDDFLNLVPDNNYAPQAEILPIEIMYESGGTSRGIKKHWQEVYVTQETATGVTIATGDYPDRKESLPTVTQTTDCKVLLPGNSRLPTVILEKTGPGAAVILAIHGRIMVNA